MNTKKSNKSVKDYFDFTTKKGQKIIVAISICTGLLGGYVIGHYGNNDITGYVATYKGGSIKRSDFYEKLKNNTNGSGLVKSSILLDIFGQEYGKNISDKTIQSALAYYKQAGYKSSNTESERKETTRQQLAFEKGLKENLTASNKEMKEAFKDYKQPISFGFVGFSDKKSADKALDELKQGKDMKSVSSNSSVGTGDRITYTNAYDYSYQDYSNILPDDIVTALYEMKSGDSKEVAYQAIDNSGAKQTYYYVLKVYNIKTKSGNWKNYKSDLAKIVKTGKMNSDKKAVNAVIAKEFKKYRVSIKDSYMKKALADYME